MTPRSGDPAALVQAAQSGDRAATARLLSLVEQSTPAGREVSRLLGRRTPEAHTVGVTGPPGVGKSSLVNLLTHCVRAGGESVAVLAVDPSSPRTGGALLGDRIRMEEHVEDPGVFIRSVATRGAIGGLARCIPDAIRVLDASGVGWIFLETVGVGQVEVEVARAADTTVVVSAPGLGDSVQAEKAGLLEVADLFVVNKADREGADRAAQQIAEASRGVADGQWAPPVLLTSTAPAAGIDPLWDAVVAHREHLHRTGAIADRRARRAIGEIRSLATALFDSALAGDPLLASAADRVASGTSSAWSEAERLAGIGTTCDENRTQEQGAHP